MPKAYGVNSTIASVDVCQTDKIFYRRTITFLKRCTICFNDCIVGLNWKRSLFWRKQYTPPTKLSKYYSKAPLPANSQWPVSFYIAIFKKFACFKSSDSQFLLYYLLIIYIHFPSFCPLCHQCFFIFHLKKKNSVISICASTQLSH